MEVKVTGRTQTQNIRGKERVYFMESHQDDYGSCSTAYAISSLQRSEGMKPGISIPGKEHKSMHFEGVWEAACLISYSAPNPSWLKGRVLAPIFFRKRNLQTSYLLPVQGYLAFNFSRSS